MVRPEQTPYESADVARFRFHRALKRLLHCAMDVARHRRGTEGYDTAVDEATRARQRLHQAHAQLVFAETREAYAAHQAELVKRLYDMTRDSPYHPPTGDLARAWAVGLGRAIKEIEPD